MEAGVVLRPLNQSKRAIMGVPCLLVSQGASRFRSQTASNTHQPDVLAYCG